jgi:myo-inositol-1(or 4)-monophosphatase
MEFDIYTVTQKCLHLIENTALFVREERAKWEMKDLKHKADASLVTSIDIEVESRLTEGFAQILPEAECLAEENHNTEQKSDLFWIIDPIDGTTNLVHNFPMYCISVALHHKGKTIMGIIYEITSGECFWAHEGQEGAYLNQKRINVSEADTVKKSLIATGFPPNAFPNLDKYLKEFRALMTSTQGLRRLGSAAMDLAYVACGRCDGFFEYSLKPWDIAAGAYLVQKAGGKVTDFSGGDNYLFGGEILADNGLNHNELLKYFLGSPT